MRLSTTSIAGSAKPRGIQQVTHRVLLVEQISLEHQGDLGLGLRLDDPRPGNLLAIGDGHIVEERAEVG